MKLLFFLPLFLLTLLQAQELKIKANAFTTDEKSGVTVFTGDVNIIKGFDELNASKVTIFTDANRKPIKFTAQTNVSFHIFTEDNASYEGRAQEVIYYPIKKEYHFFRDVYLKQFNEKKEISGDEIVLKVTEGEAFAKGATKEPVIMIFDLKEEGEE